MSAMKFLSSLPALLGLTGFVVYYFLARHRGGDRIASDICISWSAAGDPEDITVMLEAMDSHRRTKPKTVRSTESQVVFSPAEYRSILDDRTHGEFNRVRPVLQTARSPFFSSEFPIQVGTTIIAVHIEPLRVKIAGMIDNSALPNYNFEAKLLLWARAGQAAPAPQSYGGNIDYGHNDFMLDPTLHYDWASAKLAYLGPDDPRTIRTQLLGFE